MAARRIVGRIGAALPSFSSAFRTTPCPPCCSPVSNPSTGKPSTLPGRRRARLGGAVIGGATVAARQLPCVLSEVLDRLHGALEETRPDLVVCLGQASGRSDVSVERVAINLVDARIPTMPAASPSTSR